MNYFEYFSEIEERFARRRGSVLLLSTLDWALIETWREAGVPLTAVLRGIDDAFDRYEARSARAAAGKSRLRRVNGLAWCAQAVMGAAEQMAEAAVGLAPPSSAPAGRENERAGGNERNEETERSGARESGFEGERVARFLEGNAVAVAAAALPEEAMAMRDEVARRLRELRVSVGGPGGPPLDELDRTLTVLEERLVAVLTVAAPEMVLLGLRAEADAALAAFRGKLGVVQLRQVREQFLTRKLLARYSLPRLSLFYLGVAE